MKELPVKTGINTVTNCIKRLNNAVSSQISGEMTLLLEKIEQIATQYLGKIRMKW